MENLLKRVVEALQNKEVTLSVKPLALAPISREYNISNKNMGQEVELQEAVSDLTGNEIVISGISGLFPKSDNVQEFMDNLFNKVDMITSSNDYWPFKHPENPEFYGKVNGFDKFDTQFFKVPHGQAHFMDPMGRKVLENAYGALFDAGINPITLAGTKLGVFVGSSFTDLASINMRDTENATKYMLTGSSKTMLANRISYWVDGKGQSYVVDIACASSMVALEHAFWGIKTGKCSSAIVAGSNILLDPALSLNLRQAGFLCADGKTKCFDKNADGFVRSEAVSVLFLQRASEAKRIYAEVVHVKSKYAIRPDANFLPIRKSHDIEELLQEFYSEANVLTNDVEYVEANGVGIAIADANELEAISNVFAKNKPIKVGSVKSNMGHSEGASDICAITKVCLAYHKGKLPGNLHYQVPNNEVPGVCDGRIEVVTDNVKFKRGYTALNSFSYSGMNNHALLKGHYKKKNTGRYYSAIPRLVLASGRTNASISKIFDGLKSQSIDAEQIALLHDFYEKNVSGHTYRGYALFDTDESNKTECLAESTNNITGIKNPVWFLYSGMGSQWVGMGAELMKIPIFAASIERCDKVLKPKGIDIVKILTEKDDTIFDNILHSFLGIIAVQIGLTDLLKEMNIVPDYIIGHSVGEIGCAYADGSLTTEEAVLSSYYRGIVSVETKFIDGLMAAVGLGYEQSSLLCPPEIEVACHNSADSSTISGPAEIVKKFVEDLKKKNIFAKAVQTANIAYHSRYIAEAGPRLRSELRSLLKNPKLRSEKWICSSALQNKWNDLDVKYASAEYFTNNLLNSVYFEEAARNIPSNATIIEISPHGLMQAIVRRSHKTCNNIPLTNKASSSPVNFLLEAVGKLYQIGLNPKIHVLYPRVQYPVSTETRMLSSLVGWAHDEEWSYFELRKPEERKKSIRNIAIMLDDDDWKYISGYKRNGEMVFPEAALLTLVWETLAMYNGVDFRNMSVKFESIRFEKELYVKKDEPVRFTIGVQSGSKRFEIFQEDSLIASGIINPVKQTNLTFDWEEDNYYLNKDSIQTAADIYRTLANKGYNYENEFQSIISSNLRNNKAVVRWERQWVPFIDSLIQINILMKNHYGVPVPKFIRKLIIDTKLHKKIEHIYGENTANLNTVYDVICDTTKCGGVEMTEVLFDEKPFMDKVADIDNIRLKTHSTPRGNISGHQTLDVTNATGGNLIQVSYAGLSLKDYQNIIRKGSNYNTFGMDFSGYNHRREKVMGLVPCGALTSNLEIDSSSLLWPVPEHWTLQEAATVPLHYAMAYYCLNVRGSLQKNETVLVIGGAGALGLAVISICLSMNCTVFATVSNDIKKKFLLKNFPQLKDEHIQICNSSDVQSFYVMTAHYTKNALCDYVISCSTGEMREVAMKCVGKFGKFMNVNVHDARENMDFNMSYCWGGRSNIAITFDSIFKPENFKERKRIQQFISDGLAQGTVRPISSVVFSSNDITKAFRALTSKERKGKVVIKMSNIVDRQDIGLTRQLSFSPEALFLIISHDRTMHIELAEWLIKRGGKKIVFNVKSDSENSNLQAKSEIWKNNGVQSTITTKKLNNSEECDSLLAECEKLGPIHSIFININADLCNETNETLPNDLTSRAKVLENLDKSSREECPLLSNFVIISDVNEDELMVTVKHVYETRTKHLLPALLIDTSGIREMRIPELETILENNLNNSNSNLTCSSKKHNINDNFMKVIANIIGSPIDGDINEDKTLMNYNLNELCLEEIRGLIKKTFLIDYTNEELLRFTFARFKALSNITNGKALKREEGLRVFINCIERDEIKANEPIVKMACKTTSCISEIGDEKLSSETNLIMIPGFEGTSRIFSNMGEMLKIQAVTLQLSPDLESNNIHEMAKTLLKYIKRKFEFRSKFYILGYSFGVNIALELAALLEKEGYIGVVYCLDSSPKAVRLHLDAYLGKLTDAELQNLILNEMFQLISKNDITMLKEELNKESNWTQKLEIVLNKLKPLVTYSHDYQRAVIESIYKRIKLSREYQPNLKLSSDVVLIKGIPHPDGEFIADDYDLSQYTNKPVKIFKIESHHASAPFNYQVPNIVNKMLDPKLIESFKKMNLCESYTKDGFKIHRTKMHRN